MQSKKSRVWILLDLVRFYESCYAFVFCGFLSHTRLVCFVRFTQKSKITKTTIIPK